VFSDPQKMKKLNEIVWPAIAALAREEMIRLKRDEGHSLVVMEAAVLLEAGWDRTLCDEVWVVVVSQVAE
jgi:phosphopantetheine adenylyltransferase / dephospho-CoA kinase